MGFAEINGIRYHYERSGDGTPVVLISGLNGDTSFWTKAAAMLSTNHDVIAVDNRGAGTTEYNGPFTITDMADDVAELINHLGLRSAHIVGWSMGSHIALDLAARYPELITSLTIVSSYLKRPSRSAFILEKMAYALNEGSLDGETVGMVMNVLLRTESYFQAMEEAGKEIHLPIPRSPKGMLEQLFAVEGYDPLEDAHKVKAPTLSVHGLEDIMTPPSFGDGIAAEINGCTVYRVPEEGHILRPESYIPVVMAFIDQFDSIRILDQ